MVELLQLLAFYCFFGRSENRHLLGESEKGPEREGPSGLAPTNRQKTCGLHGGHTNEALQIQEQVGLDEGPYKDVLLPFFQDLPDALSLEIAAQLPGCTCTA